MKKMFYVIGIYSFCVFIHNVIKGVCKTLFRPNSAEGVLKACGCSDETVDSVMGCFGFYREEDPVDDDAEKVVTGFRAN